MSSLADLNVNEQGRTVHQDYTGFESLVRPRAWAAHQRQLVRDLLQGGMTSDELLRAAAQRRWDVGYGYRVLDAIDRGAA